MYAQVIVILDELRDATARYATVGASPGIRDTFDRDMEALRTKIDNLQWEVNRLDAENRRLRDENADGSARVDLEAELEQSKVEVARMAERVKTCERQLEESARAAAETEQRATLAEGQARSHEQTVQDLEATQTQLQEATEELRMTQQEVAELQDLLEANKVQVHTLTEELETKEQELGDIANRAAREREDMELERYRSMESVNEKWEAREQRLLNQLEEIRRELADHKEQPNETGLSQQLAAGQQRLLLVSEKLQSCEGAMEELRDENEGLKLEREELRAELTFIHARVRRLERASAKTPDPGGSEVVSEPQTVEPRMTAAGMDKTCESHMLNMHQCSFHLLGKVKPLYRTPLDYRN